MKTVAQLFALALIVGTGGLAAHAAPTVTFTAKTADLISDPQAKEVSSKISLTVTGFKGKVTLVRLWSNIGSFAKPTLSKPNSWDSIFTPPSLQFPSVALLRADVLLGKRLVRRWLAIRVSVKSTIEAQAPKDHKVVIEVGRKQFGNLVSDGRNKVKVPVVIPPGTTQYVINRVEPGGLVKQENKKLSLTPFQRMVIVGPKKPSAGTIIALHLFVLDAQGKPYTYDTTVDLECPGNMVVHIDAKRSIQVFKIRLSGTTGSLACKAVLKQETGVRVVHMMEVQVAKNQKLLVEVSKKKLKMTDSKSAKVLVRVRDLFGNAAQAKSLTATVNGKPLAMARMEPGLWRGWLYPPSTRQPDDRLVIKVRSPDAQTVTRIIPLLGGLATKLSLKVTPMKLRADGNKTVDLELTAVDRIGMPPIDKSGTIKVDCPGGELLYMHRVRPGLYKGRIRLERRAKGGLAVITVSTHRAPAVVKKLKLIPLPQRFSFSFLTGFGSNLSRSLGPQLDLRFEWAVYQGKPTVYVGFAAIVGTHHSIGEDDDPDIDDFWGASAGLVGVVRLNLWQGRKLGFNFLVDLGGLAVFTHYKIKIAGFPQAFDRERVAGAFTLGAGLNFNVVTKARNEFLVQLHLRYLTATLYDADGGNQLMLLFSIGYRFAL